MTKVLRSIFSALATILVSMNVCIIDAQGITLENASYNDDNDCYLTLESDETDRWKELDIYVDGELLKKVDVYIDRDDVVWVTSYGDLRKIFPEETEDVFFPDEDENIPLDHFAELYGYTMQTKSKKVYLEKEGRVPTLENSISTPMLENSVTSTDLLVFVNGLYVDSGNVYTDDAGFPRLRRPQDILSLLPEAYKDAYRIYTTTETHLQSWANFCGYNLIKKDNRIYMNNTGIAPVEILFRGETLFFPDVQPVIIGNRTMIPVRTIAEIFGCKVSYDNLRVVITERNLEVDLWINSAIYLKNGKQQAMDSAPIIYNGRTMVPLRLISEVFGYDVSFDGTGSVKLVTIIK